MAESPPSKNNKKRQEHSTRSYSPLQSVPNNLLLDVIGRVAADSFVDLHNVKLYSKELLEATKSSYVFERVTMDSFPFVDWDPSQQKNGFLNRCMQSGNPKILYREGFLLLFSNGNGNRRGMSLLEVAAEKGHEEVKYVVGMLYMCCVDEDCRNRGLQHMNDLRQKKCVVRCRDKVQENRRSMWMYNTRDVVVRIDSPICKFKTTCKHLGELWAIRSDEEDSEMCEFCRWDHELCNFFDIFNV